MLYKLSNFENLRTFFNYFCQEIWSHIVSPFKVVTGSPMLDFTRPMKTVTSTDVSFCAFVFVKQSLWAALRKNPLAKALIYICQLVPRREMGTIHRWHDSKQFACIGVTCTPLHMIRMGFMMVAAAILRHWVGSGKHRLMSDISISARQVFKPSNFTLEKK